MDPIDWRSYENPVGVDEVGRGCLAGPVCAGAVFFRDLDDPFLNSYTDSKTLSETRRLEMAKSIEAHHWVGLGFASVQEIDEHNILRASLLAMRRAVEIAAKAADQASGHLLVDGTHQVPGLPGWKQSTFPKGDLRCRLIAAASIAAKVCRDHLMRELGHQYPQYGFESNKGYGSAAHLEALRRHGPSPVHRISFRGVRPEPPELGAPV